MNRKYAQTTTTTQNTMINCHIKIPSSFRTHFNLCQDNFIVDFMNFNVFFLQCVFVTTKLLGGGERRERLNDIIHRLLLKHSLESYTNHNHHRNILCSINFRVLNSLCVHILPLTLLHFRTRTVDNNEKNHHKTTSSSHSNRHGWLQSRIHG